MKDARCKERGAGGRVTTKHAKGAKKGDREQGVWGGLGAQRSVSCVRLMGSLLRSDMTGKLR